MLLKDWKNNDILILSFLVLIGFVIRIFFSLLPLNYMIIFVPDDMFYYLKIGQNIALGKGVTFDGVTTTNGFHPLWMLIITLIFKSNLYHPYHFALIICSVLNTATAYFLFRILRIFTDNKAIILLGLFLWFFNPYVFFIGLSGVEASLSTFLLSLVLYYFLLIHKTELSIGRAIILGFLIGLGVLSRTDFGFIAIILGFYFLWKFWVDHKSIGYFAKIALLVATAVLTTLPWFLWSYINFHTIHQDSAIAHIGFITGGFSRTWQNYLRLSNKIFFRNYIGFLSLQPFIITFFGGLIVFFYSKIKATALRFKPLIFISCIYIVIHFSFYVFYFKHNQNWYYLTILFFLTILLSIFLETYYLVLKEYFKIRPAKIIIVLFVLLAILFIKEGVLLARKGFYPHQRDALVLVEKLNKMYDEGTIKRDTIFGSFNTGIKAYFSKYTFINLDGVVNHEVYPYLVDKKLKEYLLFRNIKYFAGDLPMIIRAGLNENEMEYSKIIYPFLKLKEVEE